MAFTCKICHKRRCKGHTTDRPWYHSDEKAPVKQRVQPHNQGKDWCGACGCLVRNGKCSNLKCKSR